VLVKGIILFLADTLIVIDPLMEKQKIINKTMDFDDLNSKEAHIIFNELNTLIKTLRANNLKVSSWFGAFNLTGDPDTFEMINRGLVYKDMEGAIDNINFPWYLYWEIAWLLLNNNFSNNHSVLDLGGSSSLFSFYLASKGLNVVTADLQKDLVDNANIVAKQMGWNLKNYVMDMRELNFDSRFDHITSICVYEHIPMFERVAINKQIKDLLVEGGKFSITFDYKNPHGSAKISSPEDVYEQFVKPSGLKVRFNEVFYDNGKNFMLQPFYSRTFNKKRRLWIWKYKIMSILKGDYKLREFLKFKDANDYTFAALFLENN
jgi:2-polyprenyl-3-methyl-5-hydroxy-6-metoxy-1,4-benzoquinol methylase